MQILKMLKRYKNDSTRTLELFYAKKLFRKNTKYSRNETILKIAHLAKAIAHANAQMLA